jgi:hypothetical protein
MLVRVDMIQLSRRESFLARQACPRTRRHTYEITKINKIIHVSMPYGSHKITRVRQVAIPGELLRAVGLELGDNVHFRLSDNDPHVIEIVPSDIVARRYQAGTDSEVLNA